MFSISRFLFFTSGFKSFFWCGFIGCFSIINFIASFKSWVSWAFPFLSNLSLIRNELTLCLSTSKGKSSGSFPNFVLNKIIILSHPNSPIAWPNSINTLGFAIFFLLSRLSPIGVKSQIKTSDFEIFSTILPGM